MLSLLAPLGALYSMQLVPDFDGQGNVTVTVLLKSKALADKTVRNPISISGTIAEVEASLSTELTAAVNALVAHRTSIADLKSQLEAEEKAAKAELDKARSNKLAKPAALPAKAKPAPAEAKGKAKAKPAKPAAAKPAAPAAGKGKLTPARRTKPATPVQTEIPGTEPEELAPAATATATEEPDLGSLFP